MSSEAAKELGRKGGLAKSQKKTEAVRKNARNPRGAWATAVSFTCITEDGKSHNGLVLMKGKVSKDPAKFFSKLEAEIKSRFKWGSLHISEFTECESVTKMI